MSMENGTPMNPRGHYPEPNAPQTTTTPSKKKKGFMRRFWVDGVIVVAALLLGAGWGAVASGQMPETVEVEGAPLPAVTVTPEPLPAVTVTPDPEIVTEETIKEVTVEVVDPTCQVLAVEYHDLLSTAIEDVVFPYSEVTQSLIGQLQYGASEAELNRLTGIIQGVTSSTEDMTDRVVAAQGDFEKCQS